MPRPLIFRRRRLRRARRQACPHQQAPCRRSRRPHRIGSSDQGLVAQVGTLGAPATLAQSVHYSRVEAVSGVGVQLQFHATVKKDCTLLPPPSVRVLEVPKSGTLTLRKGVATINSVAGCQAIKAPAEAVL